MIGGEGVKTRLVARGVRRLDAFCRVRVTEMANVSESGGHRVLGHTMGTDTMGRSLAVVPQ